MSKDKITPEEIIADLEKQLAEEKDMVSDLKEAMKRGTELSHSLKFDDEAKHKIMTEQLRITNSEDEVINYIRWIIKSDIAKEYWKAKTFPSFFPRLLMFVENVKVNDQMSEEEKEMIINVCKMNINN